MKSEIIRKKFLEFFKERGHALVPSSSLVPDDPSVLLTTAGMQQFKRYYTGELNAEKDFGSKNTASIQKCFRTSDIDEVGDESHLTFFEMLGNFSFGGYWKKEAIEYAREFITGKDWMGLGINSVSVFGGDSTVPPDEESEEIWKSLGIQNIQKCGKEDNFWGPTGSEGPCGPTTEIYVKNSQGQNIEIWNIVFNEFYQTADGRLQKLKTPGVDTGMGLERLAMVAQKTPTIFETDLFESFMKLLPEAMNFRAKRLVVDHLRGIAFLIADGVRPSNKEAGYVLRRLVRRVIVHEYKGERGFYGKNFCAAELLDKIIELYHNPYPQLEGAPIVPEFNKEKERFIKTLEVGLKELGRLKKIDARSAFKLYESFGLPYEIIKDAEFSGESAKDLTREDFEEEFKKHQEISRLGAEKKFGGHGLVLNTGELKAGNEEEIQKVTRLHTATHLLQQALREVLGAEVRQRGSDITPARARFDFSFSRKMTPEEIKRTEEIVNQKIKENLAVQFVELSKTEAEKTGALYFFKEKYPEKVKVYFVGDSLETAWSKEFCGGPHVNRTGEIGKFKIIKEEAVGAGARRIRAVAG
jgi:alanyl-tRNA synthetase